ncbi:MAG: hypothetical protein PVJ02_08095 [Gemmatimonadota bacterium]|jgi:hypothetical protein
MGRGRRGRSAVLWVVSFVLMFAAASYQRRTGPTYEYSGEVTVDGRSYPYALLRSEETTRDARIAVPMPGNGATGEVFVRRYPTDDPFTPLQMQEEPADGGVELVAYLPAQPSAGKLEYYVELHTADGVKRIPPAGGPGQEPTIVMRYKDPVPLPVLLAHVIVMFFSMLIGVRAAFAALADEDSVAKLSWVTLGGLALGGLILGPVVQKYAFGAFWTGFPWGYDLTDNKTLIMWLVWAVACAILWAVRRRPRPGTVARGAVVVAAVVTVGVYLVPHSLRGSQLDYGQMDQGVSAPEAIQTGG